MRDAPILIIIIMLAAFLWFISSACLNQPCILVSIRRFQSFIIKKFGEGFGGLGLQYLYKQVIILDQEIG